ncbi:MAG: MFS transporter [Ignavibacteriales bacterium]|nr:MFS transporter [Ignavibacteriales bacterium]
MKQKILTRTVIILSLVSLFTDIASEMLYPILPMYLASVGFSAPLIGLLEGLAEAVAGFSKGYFGRQSDLRKQRTPFVRTGYTLSAVAKPLMAVWTAPLWVFSARTMDRLGKGIRTGARDAILSAEATPGTKARVFGFHRSLDTLGAVIGPLAALLFLQAFPAQYRSLFLWSAIPGLCAAACIMLIKERSDGKERPDTRPNRFFDFLRYWPAAPAPYRALVRGLLLFALINSSDIFLLMMAKHRGLSDAATIGVYVFYNTIYAFASYPAGKLADGFGLRKMYVTGLFLFGVAYGMMAMTASFAGFFSAFFIYGLYAAANESVAKAWITNICPKEEAATAIGFYTGIQSVAALLASTIAGIIWYLWTPSAVLGASALGALLLVCYFIFFVPSGESHARA